MQLAKLIELAEVEAGGTNALGRLLGVPGQHVSGWKNGDRTCAAEDRALLAVIAHLDPYRAAAEAMIERWQGKPKGDLLAKAFSEMKTPHEGASSTDWRRRRDSNP